MNSQIFIIGMPRSGTKLLRGLLNGHSKIFILNRETEFLPYWQKNWKKKWNGLADNADFNTFYRDTVRLPCFLKMKDENVLISKEEWLELCSVYGMDMAGVFEAFIRHGTDSVGMDEIVWGDKSPSYVSHIPTIMGIYPEAKIVHIIRDVRDYCLSIHNAWKKNMTRAAVRWADCIKKAHEEKEICPESILEVSFEDLLDEPERVLKEICGFAGLGFEPEMLNLSHPTENLGDARGEKRIVAGNKKKYRSAMDAKTLYRIEAIAGEVMAMTGYEVESGVDCKNACYRPGSLAMTGYALADKYNFFREFSREVGVAKSLVYNYRGLSMK